MTLIEILVAVAILALVLALGVPSLGTYLQGAKLANATSGYVAALQMARAEAIRRNVPVEFILTETAVDTADLANAVAPSTTGRNYVIRASDPTPAATFLLVEAKAGAEGGGGAGGTSSITVTGAGGPAAFDGRVPFNGLGSTVGDNAYTLDIANPAGGACAPAGPMRCLRVFVRPGGQIGSCDTQAAFGDSRAC